MSQATGEWPTRRQTVEQERAAYALACIRQVKGTRAAGEYRREVMGLPAMVLVNGLGQTLAFLKAKKKLVASEPLSQGVRVRLGFQGDLLDEVTRMDVATYRLAQLEALAVLGWLKRFAEAELPEPEGS